jgi:signal peptidase II
MAVLVVVADQVTKYLVRTQLPPGASWEITQWLRPIVQITHVTNTGVAFGMFPGLGIVGAAVSAVISVIIIIYQRQIPHEQWPTRLALGLMLGGAIGNLIDRVALGSVVDFVDLNFWPLRQFPVFNVADSSVTVGTIVLLVLMVWEERREATAKTVSEETVAESS